jgi:hypothetical protein
VHGALDEESRVARPAVADVLINDHALPFRQLVVDVSGDERVD